MKTKPKRRLKMEWLEARWALATASISGGNLNISDNAPVDLLVEQTALDTWEVSNFGVPLANSPLSGVTGNVTIRTGSGADAIEINLNGFSTAKGMLVSAGGGANNISIVNGTIAKTLEVRALGGGDTLMIDGLSVTGTAYLNVGNGDNLIDITESTFERRMTIVTGDGEDNITFGNGNPTIFDDVVILDFGGAPDALLINDGTIFEGSLVTDNVNNIVMSEGAEIQGSVWYDGGYNVDNTLIIDGIVDGDVSFFGNAKHDVFTLGATSSVGRSVQAYMRGGDDQATFSGSIERTLYVDGQGGNDSILLEGSVGLRASLYGNNGADQIFFSGTVGVAPSTAAKLVIDGGAGGDQVAIRDGSEVAGQLSVSMGAGDDEFFLAEGALLTSASINGGSGSDTYYGNPRPRASVVDKLFELFFTDDPLF